MRSAGLTRSTRRPRCSCGMCCTRPSARLAPSLRSIPRPARCCGSTSKTRGRAARARRERAPAAVWRTGRALMDPIERIIYVTPGYRMVALDAKTGKPVPTFGMDGIVDLKLEDDQELDLVTGEIGLNATPLVAGDVVVVGAAHRPGGSPRTMNNAKGYVRGYDAKTGKRLWIFHTLPKPGEFGYDTWLDEQRGEKRQHRRVGADERRSRARPRLRGRRDADRRLLRRQPAGRHAVRRKSRRARPQDRHAQVALSVRPSRHLGLRSAVRGRAVRRDAERPAHPRGGAADQAGVSVRAESRDRRTDLADRGASGAAVDRAERTDEPDATFSHQARFRSTGKACRWTT